MYSRSRVLTDRDLTSVSLPSVIFSHVHIFKNHRANVNQTCQKAFLEKEDSRLYK